MQIDMKKILFIILCFGSLKMVAQTPKTFFGKKVFADTVYFKVAPYNSGSGVVHLGIDTVAASPTFGKLVRKTASAATPGIDDVLAVGQSLTANRTINLTDKKITISGAEADNVVITTSGAFGQALDVRSTEPTSHAITALVSQASTNSVTEVSEWHVNANGTAANGIGAAFNFYVEASASSDEFSNGLVSRWVTANSATRTSQFNVTGVSNAVADTLMNLGSYVTLSESSDFKFHSTTIATGKVQGGTILITVEANDATDYQSRTLRFIWSAVNKAGTLTITISTPEEVVAVSSGTLTATITTADAGSGVLNFRVNATSSLTQSTLRATYQTFKNF